MTSAVVQTERIAASPSYAVGALETPFIGSPVGAVLDEVAAAHPDGEALVSCHQRRRYRYGELLGEVDQIAKAFIAVGLNRGDRIAVWSGNCAEWVIAQYAAAKIGAILVTLNPAYRADDLEYALDQSGAVMLIASPRYLTNDQRAIVAELRPRDDDGQAAERLPSRVPSVRSIVWLDAPPSGGTAWAELAAAGSRVDDAVLRARARECQFDDPAIVLYTSGTTGRPKGVALSHHTILNCGLTMGDRLGCAARDRICLPVPLFHCLGSVMGQMAALTHASAVVLPGEAFEAGTCLDAIEAERCTVLYGVPTMFIAQLAHPSIATRRLDSLRTGIMAGAPCPADVMRQVMSRLHVPDITICYGMTETPAVTQTRADDGVEDRVSTVGTLLPHIECKIVDPETGQVVPRGEPGEICVRGFSSTLGYWNDAAATRGLIDNAGWLHTGDLASMRPDGALVICGRLKDLIIRGGENIYPREIEDVLSAYPKVLDAYVVGVPDPFYGEETCAWVRLRHGETATAAELRRHCRDRLASYKIPRYVWFTDALPMTATGKVQKFRLREMAREQLN